MSFQIQHLILKPNGMSQQVGFPFVFTLPELGKTLLRTVNNPEWFDEYYNPSSENNKIPPLEKHKILIKNIIRHFDKKWHGSLIYFPVHFLQKSCHDTDVFLNKIKEIGWGTGIPN